MLADPEDEKAKLTTEDLIARARAGDETALGQILSAQRSYLRVLARVEVGRHLQGKLDVSDIIQEAFLEAHKSFPNFKGKHEPQLIQWIRSILAHTIANTVRRYFGTQARDPRLEQQLAAEIDQSAISLGGLLVDPGASPSQQVLRVEQTRLVTDALSCLPEDYQSVLILRHLEGLTFPKIAERMGKTVDSVEKLWLRGLTRLKKEFARTASASEVK
ncbi:ECF RNA polymerase sigma-E factor [Gimesia alba]|uniref:ECF RNA polymerase sigma-E factor n=1 Tax=Gimesia alba TaxID=2527973 RepID=A0A517RCW6_9PLAN|nr:sigma-70 family RNA polymerase sigma factor [Gimesia alba]QDT41725.1 ECF RNA polymerase sigma-E factor [Gimesia alba]